MKEQNMCVKIKKWLKIYAIQTKEIKVKDNDKDILIAYKKKWGKK